MAQGSRGSSVVRGDAAIWVVALVVLPIGVALAGLHGAPTWHSIEPALLGALVTACALGARHGRRVRELEAALDDERRGARAALQERLELREAKRRLLASISHELRTPLTSIKGYTEILQAGRLGPLTERQARALGVVGRAVCREEALVENLLCFARLEAGRYRIERETFDLRELATATRDALLGAAARRDILLVLALPGQPIAVAADRAGVETVLAHLVENALKFTPASGTVELRVDSVLGRARVTVSDTGPGIPATLRPRVFEAFFQADTGDTREHGGAGLGLPIVRGILEAHGVAISVDERPGGGCRFRFAFPLVATPVAVL